MWSSHHLVNVLLLVTIQLLHNPGCVKSQYDGNTCLKRMQNMALLPSPDTWLRTPQLISKYGYPVEKHTVTSEDGYKLTLHRIPHGKEENAGRFPFPAEATTRPAVIVHHGLMQASSDWLMNREDHNLPYILANAGYDVWLANARGSSYSKKHVKYKSTWGARNLGYWKYSFHEMGKYDVPAIIDYILRKTNEPKLYYIGHSMGATVFFIGMSLRPEYNAKIRSFYGMAPASYLGNIRNPYIILSPLAPVLEIFNNLALGSGEFLPTLLTALINTFGPFVCAPSPVALTFCGAWFFSLGGFNPCQFNTTQVISNICGHAPDITSSHNMAHFIQLAMNGKFRPFDYGRVENQRQYGQPTPPDYKLSKITAKTVLLWGENDIVVTPKDVAHLASELPNVILNHRIPYDLFSHLDFSWAIDVKSLVYDHVLEIMAKNYE